jgi:NAD(P)-dependent dehydrogenase (short-subunit alcohol dehydrogenase family)
MMQRLAGKIAIVFGGASGIGAAVVRRFVEEGAHVIACDIQAIEARQSVQAMQCDVTDDVRVREVIGAVEADHGRIDVLVNAAGIVRNDHAAGIEDEVWARTLDVNLEGTMRTMRAVLPGMMHRRSGSIVNIASVAAFNAGSDTASYAASKAGVVALTRSAAQRYGQFGIRVNALCPGWVRTPMSEKEMIDLARELGIPVEQAVAKTVERIALGRMATPDEMASVCLFLASDDASFVTGAALVADGGMRVPASSRAV